MDRTDLDNPDGTSDGPPDQGNEDSSLNKSGKIFGGLVADIRRKAPWYLSDFRDGLHVQCLTSTFLIYCGSLTLIITFGGILGSATDYSISMTACLISFAICGLTYHLFCGQPLTLLSSTGSILILESIVYRVCTSHFNWDYLAFRFWIGFWIFVIFLIYVAFDLSYLVRYITRFTQECFATLLAFILIYEAFSKQLQQQSIWQNMRVLDKNCVCHLPSDDVRDDGVIIHGVVSAYRDATTRSMWTNESDFVSTIGDCRRRDGYVVGPGCQVQLYTSEFFFSLFLFLGTCVFVLLLKLLKKWRLLPFRVRACISDLAIVVVVCLMVLISAAVGVRTVNLRMPFVLESGRPDRGWIINPLRNPWLSIVVAIPPALLAAVLMFIDQHFPTVVISRKEKKLKKGSGFHLDLFIIALQIILCSAFGCPWFVGATILSINHIYSLTMEAQPSSPAEQPAFLGIREQRVTGILSSLLIGLSLFGAQVLTFVPMSVLYGVLLYMGVASLHGLQFVERIFFFCKRRGCVANVAYLRRVPNRRVCLFTFFQVVCFAVSCFVKRIHFVTILFPLMVVATCVVRKALERVFTYEELLILDDILPGSRRRRTENAAGTEGAGSMELQAEAGHMMPTARNFTGSPEATGVYEDPLPDTMPPPYNSMPPPYHLVVQQTK